MQFALKVPWSYLTWYKSFPTCYLEYNSRQYPRPTDMLVSYQILLVIATKTDNNMQLNKFHWVNWHNVKWDNLIYTSNSTKPAVLTLPVLSNDFFHNHIKVTNKLVIQKFYSKLIRLKTPWSIKADNIYSLNSWLIWSPSNKSHLSITL